MYRVAILGCENSHANAFLKAVIQEHVVSDVEFVGVYSDDRAAAEKLHEEFGVYVAERYDEFVGKVDGIIITARHGDKHYKYAQPYMTSGIPMFIDKPLTCKEEDAAAFRADLEKNQIPVCGGSSCVYAEWVQNLKKAVEESKYGKTLGGYLRAPKLTLEEHGGFFFYAQHLVQVMSEIFGDFPKRVTAKENGTCDYCMVSYENFIVHITYVEGDDMYYAGISCEKEYLGKEYGLDGCFQKEFMSFYELLCGKKQKQTYKAFFAPVYVMNAIDRARKSGKEEEIYYE